MRLYPAGIRKPRGGVVVPPPPPPPGSFRDGLAAGVFPDGESVQWPILDGQIYSYTGNEPNITYSQAIFGSAYSAVPSAHLRRWQSGVYTGPNSFGPRQTQASMQAVDATSISFANGTVHNGKYITGTTVRNTNTNTTVVFNDCIIDQTAMSGGQHQSCYENTVQNSGTITFNNCEFRGTVGGQQCLLRPRDGDSFNRCYMHHPAADLFKSGRSEQAINQGWSRGGATQCFFLSDAYGATHNDFVQLVECRGANNTLVFSQNFIWMPGLDTSWRKTISQSSQPHAIFYIGPDAGTINNITNVDENVLMDRNICVGGVAVAQMSASGTSSRMSCIYFRKNVHARVNGGGFQTGGGGWPAANGLDSGNRLPHHYYGAGSENTSTSLAQGWTNRYKYETIVWNKCYDIDGNPTIALHNGSQIPVEINGRMHFFRKSTLSPSMRGWLLADNMITASNDPVPGVVQMGRID